MQLKEKDWFIPLIYLFISLLWILFSDNLLYHYVQFADLPFETSRFLSKTKGYSFVILTAILLYFLIRQKTKALKWVKNDFKRLFENNPNAMWIFDTEHLRILLVNKAACQLYGYDLAEFKGLSIYDLRPPSEHQKFSKYYESIKEIFSVSGDWLHQDKNGQVFYVNVFSHETFYKGIKCRLVTAIDVNKRVIAEMEKENTQKAINRAALVSVIGTDGTILEVNNLFCSISGYDSKELVGKHISLLDSAIEEKAIWNEAMLKIRSEGSWRGDVRCKAKSGDFFWVDMVLSPVKSHKGEVYKYMSLGYDITDRKDLELTQQLLLDDFSEYAFQTSHELRGPLSSMLGLISIFKKFEDPSFLIHKMKETSEKMDQVIRKMNDSLTRNSLTIISKKRKEDKN